VGGKRLDTHRKDALQMEAEIERMSKSRNVGSYQKLKEARHMFFPRAFRRRIVLP
jgi:hypothetical protein